MVTGLGKELPNRVQQEQRFHMSVVDYRRRLRDAVRDAGSYTLEQEDALAIELERDLDHLQLTGRQPRPRAAGEAHGGSHAVRRVAGAQPDAGLSRPAQGS